MCVCVCACMYVCMYVCVRACVHTCVPMYVCMYVMCLFDLNKCRLMISEHFHCGLSRVGMIKLSKYYYGRQL